MNDSNNVINDIKELRPVLWENPEKERSDLALGGLELKYEDILDAEGRLERFAPLIKRLFPETVDGIIESQLKEIPLMKKNLEDKYNIKVNGRVFLKCDSHLKIAGSIKARGGIYEVLKHAEGLALSAGMLSGQDDYSSLSEKVFRDFFSNYKIAVGSTGNLGLSIGIMAAALGFKVTVHMSRDAKQWKKELLRSRGAEVIEYEDDYSRAVEQGRKECAGDPCAYFIDDENSKDLFLGYSVAAIRLKKQLGELGVKIDSSNPLYIYLPCGVGGAPGGITFGLKHLFGENVHCYFVEPTHSPCMLLGLITKKYDKIHVRDFGIDNITEADGLAVGSPSGLVARLSEKLIDGIYTIEDNKLFEFLAMLKDSENIKIEPSAASSLLGPLLVKAPDNAVHISWATGGLLLPESMYNEMYKKGKELL